MDNLNNELLVKISDLVNNVDNKSLKKVISEICDSNNNATLSLDELLSQLSNIANNIKDKQLQSKIFNLVNNAIISNNDFLTQLLDIFNDLILLKKKGKYKMDIGLIIGIIIVVIIVVIGISQKEKIKELLKKNQNNVSKPSQAPSPIAKDIPNYEELDKDLLDLIVNLNEIIN